MVKKAVIVSDRWGPSIHGGITDATHLVIKLLQDMNISVHCTALKASEEEEQEAEDLGVTLELPTKTGTLQFREPTRDWLLYHNEHYPDLEELANVKFVFGFSAFTSEATFKILNKVFPKASCYLINLFDKDDITPLIVGCSEEELKFRKLIMSNEFKNAKCSFSIGESVHARYSRLYQETNQELLSPMVNKTYLTPERSDKTPIRERERFQILSVVQGYEFEDPKKLDVVINAVKQVADKIYELHKIPPAWKIIGIPKWKEEEIVEKLTRSSRLKITPKFVTNTDELNRQLLSSHLVLIPPSTTSYVNLTLAAMSAEIPVVYPRGSHSDEIVCKHMDKLEAKECAVDMNGDPKDLTDRILSVMLKNPTALQRAKIIRDHIQDKVVKDLQDSNGNFIAALTAEMSASSDDKDDINTETKSAVELKDGTSCKYGESRKLESGQPSKYDHTRQGEHNSGIQDVHEIKRSQDSPSHQLWTRKNKRKRRRRQIEIKVKPDGVIPIKGKKVREVTAKFYSSERTKDNAVLVGKQLDQRRQGTRLLETGEGSISYIIDCQSLEALESLMGDYSSGSLHRMVKSTFLSETLLDEIGALYLSLGTSIDYEEYLLCKEELEDTEGEKIYPQSIEAIEEMNEKMESDIKGMKASVTMGQANTRQKARDRDILRAMSVKQERERISELDELMNEWINIQTELQQLNASHSELVLVDKSSSEIQGHNR
ncbi:uncharacterized protein [Ptychodera flava]|uniref:uncharacterized protein n=1 Tax=Ptychodera flava TaxID=63121 RepID=UPI003969C0CD